MLVTIGKRSVKGETFISYCFIGNGLFKVIKGRTLQVKKIKKKSWLTETQGLIKKCV